MSLQVLEGVELRGQVNTTDADLISNIQHSIRLGHPQVRPQGIQPDRVILVGGGPSLRETETELVDLYFQGAKIFALNGAAAWCRLKNLRPSAQIVVDARASNAKFVETPIPNCRYLLASQCHPATWAAVAGRPDVWVYHAVDPEGTLAPTLSAYYGTHWTGIGGGTTVAMRALALLRTLGYVRFDLFGIDSCWLDEVHHAYPQAENEADRRVVVTAQPAGDRGRAREFVVSPWHLKQLEDFLQLIRLAGDQFLLNVHGRGLLAYALEQNADLAWSEKE